MIGAENAPESQPAAPAPDWDIAPENSDPLAECLAVCLRLKGRDVGVAALLSGLPLPRDGRMTPRLAVQAAEGHGHQAMLTRQKRLSHLPEAVLPAVLFLAGREACVLISRDPAAATAEVVWPARGPEAHNVPLKDLEAAYFGQALVLRADTQGAERRPDAPAPVRHWFWSVAARAWPDYLQVMLASAIVNVLALATPLFTMNVYDRVFPNAAVVTLWSLVAGVGVALVLDAVLKYVRANVVDRVGRRVDLSVSAAIFRHIADLKLEAQSRSSGALVNTLKDYEQIRDFFSSQTLASLTDLAFSLLFIAVIAYLGGPLALPPLVALILILVVGLVLLVPLRRASNATRQTGGVKNAVAVEAVTELETLKAIAGQGRMQGRWEAEVTQNAIAQERSRRLATFATTFTGLVQQMSSIGIVVIGVYLALTGSITMGAVIAAMILSGRALAPTAALSGLFVRGSFAFATLRSLNEIMKLPTDNDGHARHLNAQIDDGAITLDKVSLRYPDTEGEALRDLSIRIKGQEHVAIIGAVGAGKTSLVRLMAGLYTPSEGQALLDGLNMQQLSAARVRQEVQLVPQDAVLFSGTLAENIAFGAPHARDADILRAARTAGVDRIAAAHPNGFAMPIAERGRNLSGGQRQMVALARALLPRPKVLILDEPTSSMDMQSERLFIHRLSIALKERPMTLIVSTHRMGLLELVDRLVLLDKGQKLQDGPKEAVIKALEQAAKGPET